MWALRVVLTLSTGFPLGWLIPLFFQRGLEMTLKTRAAGWGSSVTLLSLCHQGVLAPGDAGAAEGCHSQDGFGGETPAERCGPVLELTPLCLSLPQRVRDGKHAVQASGEALLARHPCLCPWCLGRRCAGSHPDLQLAK